MYITFAVVVRFKKKNSDSESSIFPLSNTYNFIHWFCLKYQLNDNFIQLVEKCHLVVRFNERVHDYIIWNLGFIIKYSVQN